MGWSAAKYIRTNQDFYDAASYKDVNAKWFFSSFWNDTRWGWVYTNDTDMSLKLTKITFSASAGNSNGKQFCGGFSGGTPVLVGPVNGTGCNFTADIYVPDGGVDPSTGKHTGEAAEGVGVCTVESILGATNVNCHYGGVIGATSLTTQYTSFADPNVFTGLLARRPKTIEIVDAPVVPPGGQMFVVVRVAQWLGDASKALLVLVGDETAFSAELEPEDDDYIWVCLQKEGDTEPKWYKERKAFMRTSAGWEEMEG